MFMFWFNTFTIVIAFVFHSSSGGLFDLTWTESAASLPQNDTGVFAAYDKDSLYPECIFIFGGFGCTTCAFCYNITDDTITTWSNHNNDTFIFYYADVYTSSFFVGDDKTNIYFLSKFGHLLHYNLITRNLTLDFYDTTVNAACLVKDPIGYLW